MTQVQRVRAGIFTAEGGPAWASTRGQALATVLCAVREVAGIE